MKLLIIDNGTSYLPQLLNLVGNNFYCVIKYFELDSINIRDYDAVVLSGGHDIPISGNEDVYKTELDLVRNLEKPIFGICFGFEIIARAFGAKLEQMPVREHGVLDIEIVEPDKIFVGIKDFQVFESHRWVVKEPIKDLLMLARSKDGIEAIKHKIRPIYAVQFHPEMFIEKTCGDEIFRNFLNILKDLVY